MMAIIVWDIRYFGAVMLIYLYAFSRLFYIIGRNQINFDCADPEAVMYGDSKMGAAWYAAAFTYGALDDSMFHNGRNTQHVWLYIIFYLCMFIILIHFLNMIIAIMAESFSARNEIQK